MGHKKEKTFEPENISLIQIHVIKSEIDQREYWNDASGKRGEIKGFTLVMAHETAFDFEHHAARIRLSFQIKGYSAGEKAANIRAEFILDFHFLLKNFPEYPTSKDERKEMNFPLVSHMMQVANANVRGIIWQFTVPTLLDGVILPLIDVLEFLRQWYKKIEFFFGTWNLEF